MRCSRKKTCRPAVKGDETLQKLVRIYIQDHRRPAKKELEFFKKMSFKDAVEHAALAIDDTKKRYSHQRRLERKNLGKALRRLNSILPRIMRCSNFAELLELVEAQIMDIKGLAELYCYDTALRIGAKRGILPKHVYLHRGTKKGAKNLGISAKAKYLNVSDLPSEIKLLAPHEIEDFLCIFKDELTRFNPNKANSGDS